ncbi:MAG: TadA family conjugal transfer-associated ATPase [Kineosporiaceae bacterium]|nr:TadA family conjugal transfer-associated ATPase [Kineosporiaceae bacterium]
MGHGGGGGAVESSTGAANRLLGPLRAHLGGGPEPVGARLVDGVGAVSAEQGRLLGAHDLRRAVAAVHEHTQGLGSLQHWVQDGGVTDVLVNGGGRIWVDRGQGLVEEGELPGGEPAVRALAVRLAALAGRRLDESLPWVDARLPGGIRLHAVVPPVAPEGTHISLRTLRGGPSGIDDLVAGGSLPADWREVMLALVRARAAFLVTGGTGAGKTTLLAALLSLVPSSERLVLVEDVGELRPRHPHVVRLEARHANVEGRGEVGLDVLVRQALRMRPDRLVVGECRGVEVRDLLAALNTGHSGGCGTLHANAAVEVPARLEALGLVAGLSREGVHAQASAALDVLVHVRRAGARREVVEVATVGADPAGRLVVEPALQRTPAGGTCTGPGWPTLARRLGLLGQGQATRQGPG